MNFIAGYSLSQWDFYAKIIRVEEVVLIDWIGEEDGYEHKITTDLALAPKLGEHVSLALGGVNIFDVCPRQQDRETESGGLWDPVQTDFTGAFCYTRLRLAF